MKHINHKVLVSINHAHEGTFGELEQRSQTITEQLFRREVLLHISNTDTSFLPSHTSNKLPTTWVSLCHNKSLSQLQPFVFRLLAQGHQTIVRDSTLIGLCSPAIRIFLTSTELTELYIYLFTVDETTHDPQVLLKRKPDDPPRINSLFSQDIHTLFWKTNNTDIQDCLIGYLRKHNLGIDASIPRDQNATWHFPQELLGTDLIF